MARYIDEDKLIEALPKVTEDKKVSLFGVLADLFVTISDTPTADVVEVVRCGQCKYWKINPRNMFGGQCRYSECAAIDHYCSYGKRKYDNG